MPTATAVSKVFLQVQSDVSLDLEGTLGQNGERIRSFLIPKGHLMGRRPGKRKENTSVRAAATYRQGRLDLCFLAGLLVLILLVSLFPIRSNDVWWHLAVGKQLIQSRAFINEDPFTFTVTGSPWVPHAYLASVFFYVVHLIGSIPGLIICRAILVLAIFALLFRILKRAGIPFLLAVPFVVLGMLVMQTRFLVRPHLFEYIFIMLLLGFLLFGGKRSGFRFYGPPVLLQILWVNTHPSFYIGPVIVLMFAVGQLISSLLTSGGKAAAKSRRVSDRFARAAATVEAGWKPLAILFLLLIAASFVNPSPAQFVLQPLGGEQRELVTKYTIEWRSPFDPVIKEGAFHPYYEIYLALTLLTIALSLHQKRFSAVLLVGLFAYLSLQAHRFRVELVLVTLPFLMIALRNAAAYPSVEAFISRNKDKGLVAVKALAIALAVVLVFFARDRFVFGLGVSARHPAKAMDFIRDENIAQRPFHTIGFGSYLLWKLYPERRSFIDGRNFHTGLYRDFIACQSNVTEFQRVIDTYNLDAFLLPVPGRSDSGIKNLHVALDRYNQWSLVHIDSIAYVYVKGAAVAPAWLERNGYRYYRPLTFASSPPDSASLPRVAAEIERILRGEPNLASLWADLAMTRMRMNQAQPALDAISRACSVEPDKALWRHRQGTLAMQAGETERAIEALTALTRIDPNNAVGFYNLAVAYASQRRFESARNAAAKALEIDPDYTAAKDMLRRLQAAQ
jgi:tetratricopeptide (TPR) repeat protein